MLDRTHVAPFTRVDGDTIAVEFLRDADGRTIAFLDRMLRLMRRIEGRDRAAALELVRRQERRVRDAARLAGIARTLIDACDFRAPPGAERAAEVRDALFTARGALWPPLPGDDRLPYETAALVAQLDGADDVARLLYADVPRARILRRAPRFNGRALLDRYNTNLARALLLDAVTVTLTARGGWRGIFRAIKLARLMYTVERAGRTGRSYRVLLTGPAAAYLVRPQRYGIRFARVVPALTRAPSWHLEADILKDGRQLRCVLDARTLPVPRRRGRPRYDSRFEQALADEFAQKVGDERAGWTLTRETTPVAAGEVLFLPDFTARNRDGREVLIEIVGFWTPEYLEEKLRKLHAARIRNLVLVVYRELASGGAAEALENLRGAEVVWFEKRPRIGAVMEAVERAGRG